MTVVGQNRTLRVAGIKMACDDFYATRMPRLPQSLVIRHFSQNHIVLIQRILVLDNYKHSPELFFFLEQLVIIPKPNRNKIIETLRIYTDPRSKYYLKVELFL